MHERSTNLIGIELGIVDEFQVGVDSRRDQTTDERPEPVLTKTKKKKEKTDRSIRSWVLESGTDEKRAYHPMRPEANREAIKVNKVSLRNR